MVGATTASGSTTEGPVEHRVVRALERASLAGGIATLGVGVVVLIGWTFDVSALRELHPSFGSMKANAAVALVLAGAALILRHRGDLRRGAARALSGGASVIGTLTLLEYLPGWDLGIDELLFADEEAAVAPGRMSPLTAVNLVLIGGALVLFDVRLRGGAVPAEWLALAAGLLATLALLGNLYGVRALYALGEYEAVALHPAAALVVCSTSILFARPARGLMRVVSSEGPGGALARRLLPAAAAVPAAIGGLLQAGERAGLYDVEGETALFAASSIVCFTTATWWTASVLRRIDVARRGAEDAVRASERALRQSQARFARLVESGVVGIVIADAHGRITEVNQAFAEIVGYARAELVAGAVRWRDLTPPDEHDARDAMWADARTRGASPPVELECVRKDGSRALVLIGIAVLGDEAIAFVADLRERRQRERAEEELRRAEAHLRQSQKMEAIGRLAGGVAHDFNNLMTVIVSYGYLLQRRFPETDPTATDVGEIVRAANRAAELTRQLLAFSRRQVLQPSIVDLGETVAHMSNMLRRLIGEDIELALVSEAPIDPVFVDPGQIEQVVMNLVVNARDAMPGGGALAIETANVVLDDAFAASHPGVSPGAYVRVTVRDTGAGIDAATQAHIFEPFFTTKEAGKGTGLGLSTVLGIVEQSGGTIWVDSAPGRGTAFTIYLPRHQAGAPAPRLAAPRRAPTRGSETVLVVEDDDQVRAITRDVLRASGYHVLEANDASEALRLSEAHAGLIPLLLTDVVMPRMSGRQLAERLLPRRPEMRVLFVSGHTDDAVLRHGVESSTMAFLSKPLRPDALLAKVREVLDQPRDP